MDDFTFQDFPATVKKTSSSRRKAIVVVLILLFIGVVLIGGGAYLNSQNQEELLPTPTPFALQTVVEVTNTPTPTASPSSSVTPAKTSPTPDSTDEIDLTVDVLNGSGEAGVAKKAADILTAAGYTIGKTGNADSFEYEGVVIQIKAAKNKLLPDLRSTLAKSYTIGSTSANLSPSQTADAVVIIGKE